jgi:outer membrane receptor for ferrienterochelin and colicins
VEQDLLDTVEAVEVISAEEIAEMGAKTVAEVMEKIPGVVIMDHPQATVMMQGFEGAYVKVLIDGIEISGDTAGATPVSMIPVADIERIEIIRGASSVLYGSDAMGGVINIITRRPEKGKLSARFRQEFSSTLRQYSDGYMSYADGNFGFSLGGSFDRDDGKTFRMKNNQGRSIDIYELPAVRLGAARGSVVWYHPAGELELYGNWFDSLLNVSVENALGYDFMNTKYEGGLKGSFRFSELALVDGFFSYSRLDYDADSRDYNAGSIAVYAESVFEDFEGELRLSWSPVISHELLFGLNARREGLESDAFEEEKKFVMLSAFVQDIWNIQGADRFRIVPGLRLDARLPNDEDEDTLFKFTPKLSLRYDPRDDLVLRLSYGMGFKTPSLKQNYWVFFHPAPYNFLLLGNPGLKPETSHGFNLQADYAMTRSFSISAGAYFNYVYDLIDDYMVDPNGGTLDGKPYVHIRSYRNVGKAITSGGDLSLRYNGGRIKAHASYNLTVAREYSESEGEWIDLASRVPHQINFSLAYTVPFIETTIQGNAVWNSPQLIGAGMGGGTGGNTYTPDYLMANLRVSKFFFGETLEIFVGVQNVLNNLHFVESSDGQNQEDYYGLREGMIFSLGAGMKW